MKSLLVTLCMFLSLQAWAVQEGSYVCKFDESGDYGTFFLVIAEVKMSETSAYLNGTHFASYWIIDDPSHYSEGEYIADDETGVEEMTYSAYRNEHGEIELNEIIKSVDYEDGQINILTIYSPIDNNRLKLFKNYYYPDGDSSFKEGTCKLQ